MKTLSAKNLKRAAFWTITRAMVLPLAACLILISLPSYAAPRDLEWRGTVNSNWDTTLNTNWFDTIRLIHSAFTNGDVVTFDDSGTGNPVNITNAVQPGSVTVSAAGINYIFSGIGIITGATSLTKQNTGALTIQTTNKELCWNFGKGRACARGINSRYATANSQFEI